MNYRKITDFDKLSHQVKIKFNNLDLFKLSFTHKSYLNEAKKGTESNERLEFLGDSILSFLVTSYLYENYPGLQEGELTNLRASVVKTSALAKISKDLNLGSFLFLSRGEEEGGGRTNPSILADTFESLLGAIYLDSGLANVKKILAKTLFIILPKIIREKSYKDAKSLFQELIQEKVKASPTYSVIHQEGPDHAKSFTIGVYVENNLQATGRGKSKQDAEQDAARQALEAWHKK